MKQLAKNQEILSAMSYNSTKKLEDDVKKAAGAKDGCLTWAEFLDFFFLKETNIMDRIDANDWWNKIDPNGKTLDVKGLTPPRSSNNLSEKNSSEGGQSGEKKSRKQKLLNEFKEVPMTPALEMLLNSRKVRTELEVEEDFKNRQKGMTTSGSSFNKKKKANISELLDEEEMGDAFANDREKS